MAGKTIQVNLQFQANTTAAINNINKLNQLLTQIGTNTKIGVESGSIAQAAQAARQLQIHLQNAVNQDTGKLNLTQLNTSLRQSGLNLQQLSNQLLAAGTQGQQSFTRLATAIATADSQTWSMSSRMQSMMNTLGNTAKWMVASSAISVVTRGFQDAISHAEDLNKALNDIRIVTGYGVNSMADFAEKARIAAKELNTTSTEYAEASLIFFQQGLTGNEVLERANVVTKLAQVTGDSMETVADQMTAVWNNFYDGSKSLEEYADILTRLGAATAASTDEIAQGLEKFAAVADTVGLSYEYATSALATVVSETRQSADVVGTAFKTLFARMQDLKLGNTLEDGTTLGTYSQAMAAVGVNIKDSNGALKDMDIILDELGMRWKTLDKDQQVALAKGVAGLRQYNQFLALMSNWDEFKENLNEANEAQGELTKQAEIWQQGWEGASKRVKNNLNELYESFLNDEDIVNIADGFAGILKGINNLIDNMGGIGPLLLMIAGIFSKQLLPVVLNGLSHMTANIAVLSGYAERRKIQMQEEMILTLKQRQAAGQLTQVQAVQEQGAMQLMEIKMQAERITKHATEKEKQQVAAIVEEYEILYNTISKSAQALGDLQAKMKVDKSNLMRGTSATSLTKQGLDKEYELMSRLGGETKALNGAKEQREKMVAAGKSTKKIDKEITQREAAVNKTRQEYDETRMINERNKTAGTRDEVVIGRVKDNNLPPTKDNVPSTANANLSDALRKTSATALGVDPAQTDSFNPLTSEANYEATQKQIGQFEAQKEQMNQYASDFESSAKRIQQIDQEIADLQGPNVDPKKSKETQKRIAELTKSREGEIQTMKKSSNAYKDLNVKMGVAEKDAKGLVDSTVDLDTAFGEAGSTVNTSGEAYKNLTSITETATATNNSMNESVDLATQGLEGVATEMEGQLAGALGKSEEDIRKYGNSVRTGAQESEHLAMAADNMGNKGSKAAQKLANFGNAGAKLTTTIGQVAGSAMSLVMGIQMITQAFSEGATPMERVTGILMGLTMVMPVVTALLKALGAEKKIDTGITWLNSIANAVNDAIRKGGVVGIGLAIAATAILIGVMVAATAATEADTKATLKNNEAQAEETKGIVEATEAYREKAEAIEALIRQYNELEEAKRRDSELNAQILEQVPEMAEKYRALIKVLEDSGDISEATANNYEGLIDQMEYAAKAGDTDTVISLKNRLDQETGKKVKDSTQANVKGTQSSLAIAMADSHDDTINAYTGKLTTHVGGGGAGETEAVSILAQEGGKLGFEKTSSTGIDLNFDTQDQSKFLKQYEAVLKAKKRMENEMSSDELQASDTYREISILLEESSEQYQAATEALTKAQEALMTDLQYRVETQDGKDLTELKSYDDYQAYREEFIKQAKKEAEAIGMTAEEAEKAAIAYLHAHDALGQWANADQVFSHVQEKYGHTVSKEIQKFYNEQLKDDEEARKVFLKIDFNKYQGDEALKAEVKRLQGEAKQEELQASINAYAAVEGAIDDDMTMDKWMEIAKNENMKWGEGDNADFTSFMAMSSEAQKEYLAAQKAANAEQQVNEQRNNINATRKGLQEVQKAINAAEKSGDTEELERLKKEKKNLESQLAEEKVQLAIYQKLKEQAEEESRKAKLEREERIRNLKLEIDRYHELNRVATRLEQTMDKLSQAEKDAWGADKLAIMESQSDVLASQIKLADQRIAKTQAYLELDKQALLEATNNKVQFGANGEITNFDELEMEYRNKLANTDPNSAAGEALQLEFDTFISLVEKYEETMDETQTAIADKAAKQAEKLSKDLAAIDYAIEVDVKINDRQLKQLERQLKRLDDDAFDGAARIENMTKQVETSFANIQKYEQGIYDTLEAAGVKHEDIQAYMAGDGEALKGYKIGNDVIKSIEDYTDKITDEHEKILDLDKDINEQVFTTFEAWRDKMNDITEATEFATEMIDGYKNIIDIVGKSKLGLDDAIIKDLRAIGVEAAKGTLESSIKTMQFTRESLEKEKARLAGMNENDVDYDKVQKNVERLEEELRTASSTVLSNWQDSLQAITDTLTDNMETAMEKASDVLAGSVYKSISALEKAFGKERELAELYVDDYEKIYRFNKLSRDIAKTIDSTDNVKSKRAMRELEAEIAEYQASGKEMSDYELENLQRKYELRLAEIALEEAQNAKSIVRLQRDSEGNFGYVYTADQESVEDAEQNYADKLYEMQEANQAYLTELQQNIISNRQVMMDEISEIDQTQFATIEEYHAEVNRITQFYKKKEDSYFEQMQIVFGNNKKLYDNDWTSFSKATGYKISSASEWVDSWGETTLAIQTGYSDMQGYADTFEQAIGTPETAGSLLGDITQAWKDFDLAFQDIMKMAQDAMANFSSSAGTNFGPEGAEGSVANFRDFLLVAMYGEGGTKEKPVGGILGGLRAAQEDIGKVYTQADQSFGDAVTEAQEFNEQFSKEIDEADTKVDNLNDALIELENQKSKEISIDTDKLTKNTDDLLKDINKQLSEIGKNGKKTIDITTNYTTNGGDNLNPNSDNINGRVVINDSKIGGPIDWDSKIKDERGVIWRYDKDTGKYYSDQDIAQSTQDKAAGVYNITYEEDAEARDIKDFKQFYPTGATAANTGGAFYIDAGSGHPDAVTEAFKKVHPSFDYRQAVQFEGKWYTHTQDDKSKWYEIIHIAGNVDSEGKQHTYQIKKGQIRYAKLYDTGGYTGEWGPEGRLAMLHQKEIVLNAHDTANLLTAVDIVRSMADKLEMNASLASQGIIGLTASIAPYHGGDTLEQNVTIHAEFPNATNHSEIEEAFGNLVNLASQYANRK